DRRNGSDDARSGDELLHGGLRSRADGRSTPLRLRRGGGGISGDVPAGDGRSGGRGRRLGRDERGGGMGVTAGREVTFRRGEEILRGHLSGDEPSDGAPAIILVPDVHGVSDLYRDVGSRFAARGFTTLVVDLYTREGAPKLASPAEAMRWIAALADPRILGDL